MLHKDMRNSGFTLIELLIVIAIISLLVSILLPSLQKAKDLSKGVVCQSNFHSISLVLELYRQENNEFFPGSASSAGQWNFSGRWKCRLAPYLDIATDSNGYIINYTGTVWACPSSEPASSGVTSHLADYRTAYRPGSTSNWGVIGLYDVVRLSDIARPVGEVACIVEGDPDNGDSFLYYALFYTQVAYRHDEKSNILWCDGHLSTGLPDVNNYYIRW